LPPRLESAGRKLRQTLETHRFDPPARKQLASDDVSMQTLKFLIATAQVIEISPEIVMAAGAYADAAARVRDYLRQHGSATVAQLKELLGSSRRVMVPLVEKLDRDGITRRHGDFRLLREPPPRT
jgi:selenocysteine-specific elongation factor